MALQNRLDIAYHKISGHEGHMRRVMKERDAVMNKLGVAYLSCQELRSKNDQLRQENEELQAQLSLLTSMPKDDSADYSIPDVPVVKTRKTRRSASDISGGDSSKRKSSGLFDLSVDVNEEFPAQTKNNSSRHSKHAKHGDADKPEPRSAQQGNMKREEKQQKKYEELFSLDARQLKSRERRETSNVQATSKNGKEGPNASKRRVKKSAREHDPDVSDYDATAETKGIHTDGGVTQDLTYLSFIDVSCAIYILWCKVTYPRIIRAVRLHVFERLLKKNASLASSGAPHRKQS